MVPAAPLAGECAPPPAKPLAEPSAAVEAPSDPLASVAQEGMETASSQQQLWRQSSQQTPQQTPQQRRSRSPRARSPRLGRWREHEAVHEALTGPHGAPPQPLPWCPQLEPSERQQHVTLWARRIASDGVTGSKPFSIALAHARAASGKGDGGGGGGGSGGGGLGERERGHASGPSYVHELAADTHGVAFAFGGVDPGTLHAKGRLVSTHTVHYSVGKAGRYRLHVGLRPQGGEALPGSPFALCIQPNDAHRQTSRLAVSSLPLRGVVGETSEGVQLVTADCMGNRCLIGGAPVRVSCTSEAVQTTCVDNGDGTYRLGWFAELSGTYMLHVTIDGRDVTGSPASLHMVASAPDVGRFEVVGALLGGAVAGEPGRLRIHCRDTFGNLCVLAGTDASFGLSLLPASTARPKDEQGEEGAPVAKAGKKGKEGGKGASAASVAKAQQQAFESIEVSMPFEGRWVDAAYDVLFTAQQAGEFELHLWYVPQGVPFSAAAKQRLPSSPFPLRVLEGAASSSGSQIKDASQVRDVRIPAGQDVVIHPQFRDVWGNPSSPAEGSISATLESPDGSSTTLTLKRQQGLGAFEVRCDPHEKGRYSLSVCLDGTPISDSPVAFEVTPGAPNGGKSRLLLPGDGQPQQIGEVPVEIVLECQDRYGNIVHTGGATVAARALGPGTSSPTVEDLQNGRYVIRFAQAAAGECKIMVRLDNQDVPPAVLQFKDMISGKTAGDKSMAGAPAAAPAMATAPAAGPPATVTAPAVGLTAGAGAAAPTVAGAGDLIEMDGGSGDHFDAAAVAKLLAAEREVGNAATVSASAAKAGASGPRVQRSSIEH